MADMLKSLFKSETGFTAAVDVGAGPWLHAASRHSVATGNWLIVRMAASVFVALMLQQHRRNYR